MTDVTQVNKETVEQLANIINEVERLEKVGRLNQEQIREQFQFAKDKGHDVNVIRKILKQRKMSDRRKEKLKTEEELVELYNDRIAELEADKVIKNIAGA